MIAVSRRAGLVLDDRLTGAVIDECRRPADRRRRPSRRRGDVLALADGRRVVFAAMNGRPAFALPIATGWIQWTR